MKRSERQWAAEVAWASLGNQRRAAVLLAVGDRLGALQRSLADWVPLSIEMKGEEAVEVSFTLVLPPLSQEDGDERVGMEMKRAEAVADLAQMTEALRGKS